MAGLSRRVVLGCLLTCVAGVSIGCAGTEKATVAIEYALNPSKGLPPGLNTVAILDAQVNEVTDRKWSEMASNYIQELIQESNDRFGTNLGVADRKHTGSVMQESDMAAAGLTASANPGKVAQVLGVQGLIMCEINVKVEKHKGKGTTISAMDVFGGGGHGWGYGGGGVNTREVDKESRQITVQTDFKLVDSSTSKNWVTHSPKPYRQTDKTKVSPFFGSAKTEESMTPRDEIIGAAVESGARQFVSKMIPCVVRYEIELKSSSQENCASGVAMLRGDMPEDAIQQFKMAIAQNPDDHRAVFAAGVACEKMGRYDDALNYYKKACILKNEEVYLQAKKRMSENIGRIRPADAA